MKRLISMVLCTVLLFGMIPFTTTATSDTNAHDELIELACVAFPEYADLLQNPPELVARGGVNNETDKVIFQGTRELSNDHKVSISVYQSCYAIVMDEKSFQVEITDSDGSEEGFDYIGRVSYRVTCTTGMGAFLLDNVEYRVFKGRYGSFTNYGTYGASDPNCGIGDVTQSSTQMSFALTFSMSAAGSRWTFTTFKVYFSGGALRAETTD